MTFFIAQNVHYSGKIFFRLLKGSSH